MNRITWSVAALLIAGTTLFGQTNDKDERYEKAMKEIQALEYQLEEIVDAIRMDMYYGHLENNRGNYYIAEIMKVRVQNRHIMADLWKNRSVTLGEHSTKLY